MKFAPAGDVALSVELGDAISVETNTRVRALEYLLQQKAVPGIVETVLAALGRSDLAAGKSRA